MASQVLVEGLELPEGPCFDAAGDFYVTEVVGGQIRRVRGGRPDGGDEVFAHVPGALGAAFGPDGKLYVMAVGGVEWVDGEDKPRSRADSTGGSITCIDANGEVKALYTHGEDGTPLRPNDVVFGPDGNFWFTDTRAGYVYFATIDGKTIRRVMEGVAFPNGIAMTEDGKTLIVGEARPGQPGVIGPGRMLAAQILGPGELGPRSVYAVMPDNAHTDGMAFDSAGWLLVASQNSPRLVVFDESGQYVESVPTEDTLTTNVAFGGPDMSTLYITESSRGKGRVVLTPWRRPGVKLHAP